MAHAARPRHTPGSPLSDWRAHRCLCARRQEARAGEGQGGDGQAPARDPSSQEHWRCRRSNRFVLSLLFHGTITDFAHVQRSTRTSPSPRRIGSTTSAHSSSRRSFRARSLSSPTRSSSMARSCSRSTPFPLRGRSSRSSSVGFRRRQAFAFAIHSGSFWYRCWCCSCLLGQPEGGEGVRFFTSHHRILHLRQSRDTTPAR